MVSSKLSDREQVMDSDQDSDNDSEEDYFIQRGTGRQRRFSSDSSDESENEELSDNEDGENSNDSRTYHVPQVGADPSCPICLNDFAHQHIGVPANCKHIFCVDCILEWTKNVNSCPVDRIDFEKIHVYEHIGGLLIREMAVEGKVCNTEEITTSCEVCGQGDREDTLLLCDGCDMGYHCACLQPALDAVPADEWFCPNCARQREPAPVPTRQNRLVGRTIATERVRSEISRSRLRHSATNSSLDRQLDAIVDDILINAGRRLRVTIVGRGQRRKSRKTTKSRSKSRSRKSKSSRRKKSRSKSRRKAKTPSKNACSNRNNVNVNRPTASGDIENPAFNSFTVRGVDDELDEFYAGGVTESEPSFMIAHKHRLMSRSALRFNTPLPSLLQTSSHNAIQTRVHQSSPVPDLLGSILSSQEVLLAPSSNLCIKKGGKLCLNKKSVKSPMHQGVEKPDKDTRSEVPGSHQSAVSPTRNSRISSLSKTSNVQSTGSTSRGNSARWSTDRNSTASSSNNSSYGGNTNNTEHVDNNVENDFDKANKKSKIERRPSANSSNIKARRILIRPVFNLPNTVGESSGGKSGKSTKTETYDPFEPTEIDDLDYAESSNSAPKPEALYDPFQPTLSDEEKDGNVSNDETSLELNHNDNDEIKQEPVNDILPPHQTTEPIGASETTQEANVDDLLDEQLSSVKEEKPLPPKEKAKPQKTSSKGETSSKAKKVKSKVKLDIFAEEVSEEEDGIESSQGAVEYQDSLDMWRDQVRSKSPSDRVTLPGFQASASSVVPIKFKKLNRKSKLAASDEAKNQGPTGKTETTALPAAHQTDKVGTSQNSKPASSVSHDSSENIKKTDVSKEEPTMSEGNTEKRRISRSSSREKNKTDNSSLSPKKTVSKDNSSHRSSKRHERSRSRHRSRSKTRRHSRSRTPKRSRRRSNSRTRTSGNRHRRRSRSRSKRRSTSRSRHRSRSRTRRKSRSGSRHRSSRQRRDSQSNRHRKRSKSKSREKDLEHKHRKSQHTDKDHEKQKDKPTKDKRNDVKQETEAIQESKSDQENQIDANDPSPQKVTKVKRTKSSEAKETKEVPRADDEDILDALFAINSSKSPKSSMNKDLDEGTWVEVTKKPKKKKKHRTDEVLVDSPKAVEMDVPVKHSSKKKKKKHKHADISESDLLEDSEVEKTVSKKKKRKHASETDSEVEPETKVSKKKNKHRRKVNESDLEDTKPRKKHRQHVEKDESSEFEEVSKKHRHKKKTHSEKSEDTKVEISRPKKHKQKKKIKASETGTDSENMTTFSDNDTSPVKHKRRKTKHEVPVEQIDMPSSKKKKKHRKQSSDQRDIASNGDRKHHTKKIETEIKAEAQHSDKIQQENETDITTEPEKVDIENEDDFVDQLLDDLADPAPKVRKMSLNKLDANSIEKPHNSLPTSSQESQELDIDDLLEQPYKHIDEEKLQSPSEFSNEEEATENVEVDEKKMRSPSPMSPSLLSPNLSPEEESSSSQNVQLSQELTEAPSYAEKFLEQSRKRWNETLRNKSPHVASSQLSDESTPADSTKDVSIESDLPKPSTVVPDVQLSETGLNTAAKVSPETNLDTDMFAETPPNIAEVQHKIEENGAKTPTEVLPPFLGGESHDTDIRSLMLSSKSEIIPGLGGENAEQPEIKQSEPEMAEIEEKKIEPEPKEEKSSAKEKPLKKESSRKESRHRRSRSRSKHKDSHSKRHESPRKRCSTSRDRSNRRRRSRSRSANRRRRERTPDRRRYRSRSKDKNRSRSGRHASRSPRKSDRRRSREKAVRTKSSDKSRDRSKNDSYHSESRSIPAHTNQSQTVKPSLSPQPIATISGISTVRNFSQVANHSAEQDEPHIDEPMHPFQTLGTEAKSSALIQIPTIDTSNTKPVDTHKVEKSLVIPFIEKDKKQQGMGDLYSPSCPMSPDSADIPPAPAKVAPIAPPPPPPPKTKPINESPVKDSKPSNEVAKALPAILPGLAELAKVKDLKEDDSVLNPTQILNIVGLNPVQHSAAKDAIMSIAELSKQLQLGQILNKSEKSKVKEEKRKRRQSNKEADGLSPVSLDNIESSAVEMYNKDKKETLEKKKKFQQSVVEEAKTAIKPHYERREINKAQYKIIMKRAVNKICQSDRTMEVNAVKIRRLIRRYVVCYQDKNEQNRQKMRTMLNKKVNKQQHSSKEIELPDSPPSPVGSPLTAPDSPIDDAGPKLTLLKKEPRKIVTLPDLPLPPPPPPPRPRYMM
uniref:Protein SCAF11 n=1 Tax=Phallusia mammillata TaxID=59560 RepID=A0A6F9DRT0_9ASCI|nr:protein SCAF11 [Phallusia mammillata]